MQNSTAALTTPFGVCETPGVAAQENLPPGTTDHPGCPACRSKPRQRKSKIVAGLQQACTESMQGFDAAYRLTFYASIGALLLAVFLPGWPGKWAGRGSTQAPVAGGH